MWMETELFHVQSNSIDSRSHYCTAPLIGSHFWRRVTLFLFAN